MQEKTKEQKEKKNIEKEIKTTTKKENKINKKSKQNKENNNTTKKTTPKKNIKKKKEKTEKVIDKNLISNKKNKINSNKNKINSNKNKINSNKNKIKNKKIDIVEYYDLPNSYNKTTIKLLAQTPTTLFVYWEISKEDVENYKKQYGYDFFTKTYPILIVHNNTMNYSFEVPINDFANCWYLHVNDSNCDYQIELGRKPINGYIENKNYSEKDLSDINSEINKYPSKQIDKNYFYISTSNNLKSPNDHILFKQSANKTIEIKNIKTNEIYEKEIKNIPLKNTMKKIYNIYDLYKEIYKQENIEEIYNTSNPSSKLTSSSFK